MVESIPWWSIFHGGVNPWWSQFHGGVNLSKEGSLQLST